MSRPNYVQSNRALIKQQTTLTRGTDDFQRVQSRDQQKNQRRVNKNAYGSSIFSNNSGSYPSVPRNQFRSNGGHSFPVTRSEGFLDVYANIENTDKDFKLNFKLVCPSRIPSLRNLAHNYFSDWSIKRMVFTYRSMIPHTEVAEVAFGLDNELVKLSPKTIVGVSSLSCSVNFMTIDTIYPILDKLPFYDRAIYSTAWDADQVDAHNTTAPFRLCYSATYTRGDGTTPKNIKIGQIDLSYTILLLNLRDASIDHESPGDLSSESYTNFPRERPFSDSASTDTVVQGNKFFCKVRKP